MKISEVFKPLAAAFFVWEGNRMSKHRINKPNIYSLLGISELTEPRLVRKTFREFAKKNHPDFFPGDQNKEDAFKRVNAAHQQWELIQKTLKEIRRIRKTDSLKKIYSLNFAKWLINYRA